MHAGFTTYDWLIYLQMERRTNALHAWNQETRIYMCTHHSGRSTNWYSNCSVLESLELEVMGHLYTHWWEVIPHTAPFLLSHLARAPWVSNLSNVNYITLHNIHNYLQYKHMYESWAIDLESVPTSSWLEELQIYHCDMFAYYSHRSKVNCPGLMCS